jgi:hypothetical protein
VRGALIAILCGALVAACGSSGNSSANASKAGAALEFARCMRAHGVSNFPDPPTGGGGTQIGGSGLNPQAPAFRSAQQACKTFLPNGGPSTHMSESELRRAFAFAQCMRSHGQPTFPDPTQGAAPGNDEPVLALQGMFFKLSPGLSPKSPAFQEAVSRCGIRPPAKPGSPQS